MYSPITRRRDSPELFFVNEGFSVASAPVGSARVPTMERFALAWERQTRISLGTLPWASYSNKMRRKTRLH
jgi:hypothetical protein